jgi:hypothetical protein
VGLPLDVQNYYEKKARHLIPNIKIHAVEMAGFATRKKILPIHYPRVNGQYFGEPAKFEFQPLPRAPGVFSIYD